VTKAWFLPLIVAPLAVQAQRIAGTVRDSATGVPLGGVTVLVTSRNDSASPRATITSSAGGFSLALPSAGEFAVTARRIGVLPVTVSVRIGANEARTVDFQLARLPVLLDTVRSEDRVFLRGFGYKLTAGQTWFAQHYRRAKGFFTSGLEIELSRLHACEYLGKIPGFRLVNLRPTGGGIACLDGYDRVARYIVPERPVNCMRAYIDRRPAFIGIDSAHFMSPGLRVGRDSRIPIAAIKGIELYANPSDAPADLSYPLPGSASRCALALLWTTVYWGEAR
jgi:hypothetical protein